MHHFDSERAEKADSERAEKTRKPEQNHWKKE
jgi:hypothetical protein